MPIVNFGRPICNDLSSATSREWLVTNGIGGFASGTLGGMLTRRYHGLLIAALKPPLGRTLMVTKLDEIARYDGDSYPLYANRWADGAINPQGYQHIENFRLEGTTPVWVYSVGEALLEKRIWMQPGSNTTYVRYHLLRGSAMLGLECKLLVNYRDFHGSTQGGWEMMIERVSYGLRLEAFEGAKPYFTFSEDGEFVPQDSWYRGFALSAEQYRGFDGIEDHLNAAVWNVSLNIGEAVTLVFSTEEAPNLDGVSAYTERQTYEGHVLAGCRLAFRGEPIEKRALDEAAYPRRAIQIEEQLALAADQFIVTRTLPGPVEPQVGYTILAGYPWFGDWGRDAMVSLSGLTLATGRPEIARSILRTFAQYVDQGMLPNRFPDTGGSPEYNTVDATLWYFEAMRAYLEVTGDVDLLRELYPLFQEIVDWHQRGTRYNIQVDFWDGLLYTGDQGVQLTWMDAKVDEWVVTPRIGKAVEVNALWYNALRSMMGFAELLGEPKDEFVELADQVLGSFERFWYADGGYLFDVVDGPGGDDASLRPNQLLAVSLHHSALPPQQARAVVDKCSLKLLTPHGLRSLSPDHPSYCGRYGGDYRNRDGAYHQGTVWGWLIGPFVSAHLRVYGDRTAARRYLYPLIYQLGGHGLGSLSEIFDGDPPFTPRGCFAQAWSVAEVLRLWFETR